MNLVLPGSGLILIGERGWGSVFVAAFGACFLAALTLFVMGYAHYLSSALSPDLLQEGKLEELSAGFHTKWLLALMGMGIVIYVVSQWMIFSRRKKSLLRNPGPL